MGSRDFYRHLLYLLISLILIPIVSSAQDAGLITHVKGIVTVRKATGQTQSATIRGRLLIGDEVEASPQSSATILYYTGREVYVSAGKKHMVVREGGDGSFLKRLGEIFSNILWSPKTSKTVLGASRGWKDAGRRVVMGIYPCFVVLPAKSVRFEWFDSQMKPGNTYEFSVRDKAGRARSTATASDTNVVLLPLESLGRLGDTLTWRVTELNSGFQSEENPFSFLSNAAMEKLTRDLREVRESCAHDTTQFRRLLFESILYSDLNLLMEAEAALAQLVRVRPDLVVGHEMLAEVYTRVGKLDDAYAEQLRIRSLLETQ